MDIQKTQSGKLDKKSKNLQSDVYKNSPQGKGHRWIENEGMDFMPMDKTGKQELQYSSQTKETL